MTIRNRVTLWYASMLLVSVILISAGMYFELVYERQITQRSGQPPEPIGEEVGEVILYFTIPAMALAVAGGWWLLRAAMSPIDQLTLAAERINAENLREPLPRSGNGDEVDRLSEVLNAMNRRVADAMKEIHEFSLHASHELKTPLTILHSEIETTLADPSLSGSQRDSLSGQLDEIQRLTRIVEGLTLLARANAGQMSFAREPVRFHEIVQETMDDAVVLGHAKKITVRLISLEPATVIGDRDRLRQALLNLAENAVKYNHEGGEILIALRNKPPDCLFEITNTGPGVRPADLPRLFDKFFRGASCERNGLGLGLSIAQCIFVGHHGGITVDASIPGRTVFRAALPSIESAPPGVSKIS